MFNADEAGVEAEAPRPGLEVWTSLALGTEAEPRLARAAQTLKGPL